MSEDKPNLVARSIVPMWHALDEEKFPGVKIKVRSLDAMTLLDVQNTITLRGANLIWTSPAARAVITNGVTDIEGIDGLDREKPLLNQIPGSLDLIGAICNLVLEVSTVSEAEKN